MDDSMEEMMARAKAESEQTAQAAAAAAGVGSPPTSSPVPPPPVAPASTLTGTTPEPTTGGTEMEDLISLIREVAAEEEQEEMQRKRAALAALKPVIRNFRRIMRGEAPLNSDLSQINTEKFPAAEGEILYKDGTYTATRLPDGDVHIRTEDGTEKTLEGDVWEANKDPKSHIAGGGKPNRLLDWFKPNPSTKNL